MYGISIIQPLVEEGGRLGAGLQIYFGPTEKKKKKTSITSKQIYIVLGKLDNFSEGSSWTIKGFRGDWSQVTC